MRLILSLFILFPLYSFAKPTMRIAIIDTGLRTSNIPICDSGHFDYTTNKAEVGIDVHGHGTNIAQTIMSEANGDYCFIIFKVYDNNTVDVLNVAKAIRHAVDYGANIINISLTGEKPDIQEFKAIKYANTKNIMVFVSAGNKSKNLNNVCNEFPACYENLNNMVVVGAKKIDKNEYTTFSNYGKNVTINEYGCFNKMCGTSQSTARITGKFVNYLHRRTNAF